MSVKRALLSVYDKTGILEFAKGLAAVDVQIISTGGTAKALEQAGLKIIKMDQVTGFPEMMDGRVKTLHPKIHGGILYRRDEEGDRKSIREHGIEEIDLVAVNLYPFARTAADPHASLADVIEMIDIGGPAMLRAAAKNYQWVISICRPARYSQILEALKTGEPSQELRRELAAEAFAHTSEYDSAVAAYLSGSRQQEYPDNLVLHFRRQQALRYGENPHQRAAFYLPGRKSRSFEQLGGKELSYNNLLDLDAAIGLSQEFAQPCIALLKHTVPCGVAVGEDLVDDYKRAFATDTSSPFGGIVGINRPVTRDLAQLLSEVFYEVIVAPDFQPEALEILRKKKNLRLVRLLGASSQSQELRTVCDGLLVQDQDRVAPRSDNWKAVTKRQPTDKEWAALDFGWKVARWAKSNAVVFSSADRTLGIGLGQTSRVDSVELAMARSAKYGTSLKDSVLASDAFFPFPDGAEAAIKAGATAIIQPGGSVRDSEVITACDRLNVAMVFTGERHFRH